MIAVSVGSGNPAELIYATVSEKPVCLIQPEITNRIIKSTRNQNEFVFSTRQKRILHCRSPGFISHELAGPWFHRSEATIALGRPKSLAGV
jgi:hypothetical protein